MANANNYIKLPNQGNISSNIRLLYEMYNSSGYADKNGYFTKSDIAEIAANALLVTTSSKIGKDVLGTIRNTEIEEGNNSPLQNTKMRMQLLRILGLVSTDYYSETYAITELGELIISDKITAVQKKNLIRELFLCISSSSESYDFTCPEGFHCYLGLEICYALASLDYKIGVAEMPIITTYDYRDINQYIESVKDHREKGTSFSKNDPHFPKTNKGTPVAQPSNLTRAINQILRYCNIIDSRIHKIGNTNYYVCSEEGKLYVDKVKHLWDTKKMEFLVPFMFRKERIIDQTKSCKEGLDNIYVRANIKYEEDLKDSGLIFSPYQLLPETTVLWLLKKKLRTHPIHVDSKVQAINSSLSVRDLRLKAVYEENISNHIDELLESEIIVQEILKISSEEEKLQFIADQMEKHKNDDKYKFYPFVHSLLQIIGLNCKGEVGRYDALTTYCEHIVPVEIKSPTEELTYNQKGVRQAIENKVCSYNSSLPEDIEYATLVVGYNHPMNDSDIKSIIDTSYEKLKIKIIVTDLRNLLMMCIKVVCDNLKVDLDKLLRGYGIIME